MYTILTNTINTIININLFVHLTIVYFYTTYTKHIFIDIYLGQVNEQNKCRLLPCRTSESGKEVRKLMNQHNL